MKALILSGGTGVRLRPLTYTMPKQMIPVAGRPVLFRCLDSLRDADVTEVGIVVGDHADKVISAIRGADDLGLRITFIRQDRPRGLAHAVAVSRDFLGDDDFIMSLGDNVLDGGLEPLIAAFHAAMSDAQLLVARVTDPTRYGIADLDPDGRVLRVTEKPAKPRSDQAIVGIYCFTPEIHQAVARLRPSNRGELEITDAIQALVVDGRKVMAHRFSGFWRDAGLPAEILSCHRMLMGALRRAVAGHVDDISYLQGSVVVEPGAAVTCSELIGPVIVGAGSRINGSRLGPGTSVGAGCTLSYADVEGSIVLDDTRLAGVKGIRHSVIGQGFWVMAEPGDSDFAPEEWTGAWRTP